MRTLLTSLALFTLAACGAPSAPPAEPTTAPTLDLTSLNGHIIAMGADPHWRLDADADQGLIFAQPEPERTVSAAFAPAVANADGAQIVSAPITLTLTPGECLSEGATFAMRASVKIGDDAPLNGCAVVRWDRELTELLPAIDACIARAPDSRRVTYATRTHSGAFVRLNGFEAIDCRVALDGSGAETSPADANLQIGGDNEAIFVRAPGANPGGECYEAPEVRGADGALLGWMDDPLGC